MGSMLSSLAYSLTSLYVVYIVAKYLEAFEQRANGEKNEIDCEQKRAFLWGWLSTFILGEGFPVW